MLQKKYFILILLGYFFLSSSHLFSIDLSQLNENSSDPFADFSSSNSDAENSSSDDILLSGGELLGLIQNKDTFTLSDEIERTLPSLEPCTREKLWWAYLARFLYTEPENTFHPDPYKHFKDNQKLVKEIDCDPSLLEIFTLLSKSLQILPLIHAQHIICGDMKGGCHVSFNKQEEQQDRMLTFGGFNVHADLKSKWLFDWPKLKMPECQQKAYELLLIAHQNSNEILARKGRLELGYNDLLGGYEKVLDRANNRCLTIYPVVLYKWQDLKRKAKFGPDMSLWKTELRQAMFEAILAEKISYKTADSYVINIAEWVIKSATVSENELEKLKQKIPVYLLISKEDLNKELGNKRISRKTAEKIRTALEKTNKLFK